jgi:hypothetical protein
VSSFQLRVLRFTSNEDRNVGVSILPQRQEILIGRFGLGGVALQCVGVSTNLEMGECTDRFLEDDATMVEDSLQITMRRTRIVLEAASKVRTRNRDEATGCRSKA